MRSLILIILAVLFGGLLLHVHHNASHRVAWLQDEWFTVASDNSEVRFTASGVLRQNVTVMAEPKVKLKVENAILTGWLHDQFVEEGFATVDAKKLR